MVTFQDYINKIMTGKYTKRAKIEWLRIDDLSVASEFTSDIISGSLSITRQNGVRRSVSIKLKNVNGQYIPTEDSPIWINRKFKLSLGIAINDTEDYLFPQGVFVISDPEAVSNCSESYLNLTGVDSFSLLDGSLGGNFNSIYQLPISSNIYTTIRGILSLNNDKLPPILCNDFVSEVTPYTIRKDIGSATYGEVLIELAGILSCNIYYNELGNLVFEKDVADTTKGSLWDYSTNSFHYLGATNKYNFKDVYNTIVVIGSNINGTIATGTAINNNLQSSTRVQLIGSRTKSPIVDDNITTNSLALQRAEYELKRVVALQSSISINAMPFFHLDVDQVITLTDASLNLNAERFLIQSINLQLENQGNMSISCVKSKEFLF